MHLVSYVMKHVNLIDSCDWEITRFGSELLGVALSFNCDGLISVFIVIKPELCSRIASGSF